jgi:antitoxin (DNA-binding transcriptional repressor) of toxin-antitoxin stability system
MATTTVDIRDLANRFSEIISQAAGDEVIITEQDIPRAKLIPLPEVTKARMSGLHLGAIQTSEDFDAQLQDEFWTGHK